MSFQWIQMRISEEKDRRKRETATLERLPLALEDVHLSLVACVEAYQKAFAAEAVTIHLHTSRIRAIVREEVDGKWQQTARVEVTLIPTLPGLQIDHGNGAEPVLIEIGLLPGDKLFYRDRVNDQYVTMEELTRRILDRALFPKLGE
ncbi:MAG: hypothetical protein P4L56_04115 [Candidatus Sulfopaludibacter sp.]|nr:hypothetical protein [Candidatus Sulfopaludibacter sp.]